MTTPKGTDMQITTPPKAEPMGLYNVRVPKPLWRQASECAKREGLPLSELIRHWLRQYVEAQATSDTE